MGTGSPSLFGGSLSEVLRVAAVLRVEPHWLRAAALSG